MTLRQDLNDGPREGKVGTVPVAGKGSIGVAMGEGRDGGREWENGALCKARVGEC